MPTPDYIPSPDEDFNTWLENIIAVLTPIVTTLGMTAAEIAAMASQQGIFETDMNDNNAKQTAARASRQKKEDSRDTVEGTARDIVQRIQQHPAMTDALRASLRITIPDLVRTARTVGTEVPLLAFETRPGQVILNWGTNPGDEGANSKPGWADGAIIYRRKASESLAVQVGFDQASPFTDDVTGPATDYFYSAAYRGLEENDLGPRCPEQKVAAGG